MRRLVTKQLCNNIFSSTYFEVRGIDWADSDDMGNRQKIQHKFPNSYSHVFDGPELSLFCFGHKRGYVNSYRPLPIHLADGTAKDEQVFSCYTLDRDSGEIDQYYVSKEYNVAEGMVDPTPLPARFVFQYQKCYQAGSLIAMAEASGRDIFGIAEQFYLKFRGNSELGVF